jgi:hypothetical protein
MARRAHIGHRIARAIHRVVTPLVRHPVTAVLVGVSMLATGVSELLEEFLTEFEGFLQTYHGLAIFGAVTAMRGFAEMVEAFEWLDRDFEAIVEHDADLADIADPLTVTDPAFAAALDEAAPRPERAA